MKKFIVFPVILSMLFLASCGNSQEEKVAQTYDDTESVEINNEEMNTQSESGVQDQNMTESQGLTESEAEMTSSQEELPQDTAGEESSFEEITTLPADVRDEDILAELEGMADSVLVEEENTLPGVYQDYDASLLGMHDTTLLFFHATWCPPCRTADANLLDSDIPDDLAILKVDYDTAIDLRRKYEITSQHHFVQVDASGEMIQKWYGGNTLESIQEKL